jgi:hypothetical protein
MIKETFFINLMQNTKKEINNAAKLLIANSQNQDAFDTVNNFRALHFLPLIRMRTNLHRHFQSLGGKRTIVQRLKRIPTIIDKTKRFPDIGFASFQDIGGIRVVVENINDVYALKKRLDNSKSNFSFEKIKENDRIKEPKSKQGRGYRSLHMIYKFISDDPKYNELKIELQIRTRLQNLWSTSVEAVDIMTKQSLKSGLGNDEWSKFFEIVSSNFAVIEKQPTLPEHISLTESELLQSFVNIEKSIDAIKTLKSIMILSNPFNKGFKKGTQYCIIVLDPINKAVKIEEFKEKELEEANSRYIEVEKEILSTNSNTLAVLVSAKDAKKLQKGYAGYFLDVKEFIEELEKLKSKS